MLTRKSVKLTQNAVNLQSPTNAPQHQTFLNHNMLLVTRGSANSALPLFILLHHLNLVYFQSCHDTSTQLASNLSVSCGEIWCAILNYTLKKSWHRLRGLLRDFLLCSDIRSTRYQLRANLLRPIVVTPVCNDKLPGIYYLELHINLWKQCHKLPTLFSSTLIACH